jgi:hypothetical protein
MVVNTLGCDVVVVDDGGRVVQFVKASRVVALVVEVESGSGVPCRTVVGLPAPSSGKVYVVSVDVAAVAGASGRPTDDLMVPGSMLASSVATFCCRRLVPVLFEP